MNDVKKLKKGCLVRLNRTICFTEEGGGKREYPLTNYFNDERGTVEAHRPCTSDEQRAWYNSDESKGMNSAGESKLPPQCTIVSLYKDRVYEVLRARARVRLGWGNPVGGMAMLLCTHSGEEVYIKRELLEVL